MTAHPNRGNSHPARNPAPAEILAAREAAGLTQIEAGALLFTSLRTFQQWEYGERRMHPLFWWAFGVRIRNRKS